MFEGVRRLFGAAPAPAAVSAIEMAAAARTRGNAALSQGRLPEAAQCYREAIALYPQDCAAHLNLGYALLEQHDRAGATDLLRRAMALCGPGDENLRDASFLLAQARQQLGDRSGAIEALEAALRVQPQFAEALQALVPLLVESGRAREAVPFARQLAQLHPSADTGILLAHALYEAAQDPSALEVLDAVLATEPDHDAGLAGRGHVLLRTGNYQPAADSFSRALEVHGANPQRLVNLAAAYHRLARLDEATALQQQALALEPDHPGALNLEVVTCTNQLKLEEAVRLARQALQTHPADADLHWSLGFALLLQGRLQEGWAEHRWRWRTSAMATTAPETRPEPAWQGESLQGRDILLVAEQGFGDTLQFVRYVPEVAAQARRVVLQAPAMLHALLSGLPPNCEVHAKTPPSRFHFHCALMDLPEVFGTALENVPAPIPYLHVDRARTMQWLDRVRDRSAHLHVGISCSGNPAHTNDRQRSIPLAALAPLLQADCHFYSVQPQLRPQDEAAARSLRLRTDHAGELRDFAHTAGLLQALDLVITVDTSVAHLAGALGRPVWILLPFCPDWRWMLGRDDSPWYPTGRLYRQTSPGDWDGVVRRVQADLDALSRSHAAE